MFFIESLKALDLLKEDVIYTWSKPERNAFIVFEEDEWFVSYMVRDISIMTMVINKKKKPVYAEGPLYQTMIKDGLKNNDAMLCFMDLIYRHFHDIECVKQNKDTID